MPPKEGKKRETGDATRAVNTIDLAEDQTGTVAKYAAGLGGFVVMVGSFALYAFLTITNKAAPGLIPTGGLVGFCTIGLFGIVPRRMAWFFTTAIKLVLALRGKTTT